MVYRLDGRPYHTCRYGQAVETSRDVWLPPERRSLSHKERCRAVCSSPEQHDSFFVDIVHDEFQIETPRDINIALKVAV